MIVDVEDYHARFFLDDVEVLPNMVVTEDLLFAQAFGSAGSDPTVCFARVSILAACGYEEGDTKS